MEGMEGAGSAPVSGVADTGLADGQVGSSAEGLEGLEGSEGQSQPTQAKPQGQKTLKQQIRELGDQDMDALVRLKVNGKEKTMSVREAIKQAQLGEASQAKMQEAAHLRKQAQGLMEFAKSNPKEFFKQLGMDPYEFAESTLAEKLEMMQMSPEQKRYKELEEENRRYKESEKQQKEREAHERVTKEESKAMESLDKELTQAFKESGLPKHPFYIQQIAASMLAADNQGEELTAQEAASRIKDRFQTHTREIFEGLDAEAIRSILGDSVLKKLRQAEVARVSGKAAPTMDSGSRPAVNAQARTPQSSKTKVVTERGWREHLEALKS